jgi:signal transduction histidine kinase
VSSETRSNLTGSILVVDDNEVNRQMLSQHVAQLGHHVTAANNGRRALALLQAGPFDLVLLDVLMPEMDGFAALERIKADGRLREIPVIMISGLDEVASVVRCIEAGAEDYLTKPFDPILLRARINACLEKKRLRDAERRRAEELEQALRQLKETQDQLVAREKLASLGVLTAGIAHEIRNPLNFITNFAQLAGQVVQDLRAALDPAREDQGARRWSTLEELLDDLGQDVAKIEEHGRRADKIVRSMLLHARGQPGDRQRTDLNALVAEYTRLAYHGLRGQDATFSVALEIDLDPALPPVSVYPHELSRVVLNLTHNACYAAHQRKQSAGPGFSPRVVVRTRTQDSGAEVRFWDNGSGVPAALRDKIFTPFFTTKPAGSGTGLGLSISYDIIVQLHQGAIRVESEEGRYAEFIVTLPWDTEGLGRG